MQKITISKEEILNLKCLFGFFELVTFKMGKSINEHVTGITERYKKVAISEDLEQALRNVFVNKRELTNDEGFELMMANAGPQVDCSLPDETVLVAEDFID